MPQRETGSLPALLSQTGAFKRVRTLDPSDGLVPYDLNVSFWSDGAVKRRWIALPQGGEAIRYSATGPWDFPAGTVFVKHFELPIDAAHPESRKRLETPCSSATRMAASMEPATAGVPITVMPTS